ncbi:MAG: transglutaminase-like domain-containing protein [Planctomycetota bacterium]|nr:transglutaminase-like domain-containing protein [Planctomycetota bacterium]
MNVSLRDQGPLISHRKRFGAVAMALTALSALLVQLRYTHPLVTILEVATAGVFIGSAYCSKQQWKKADITWLVAAAAVAAIFTPFLTDRIVRMLGMGSATEIAMLSTLAWASVAAAVLASRARMLGVSVVCSGFLTLFVSCISDSLWALLFAYTWCVICLWWLVANHWERVEASKAVNIRSLPHTRFATLLAGSFLCMFAAWFASGRFNVLHQLHAQWMPTSGGTTGNDIHARAGVGEGEVLVAATREPHTFGAIDTDFFLESPEPSLYDVVSKEMGEPKKKNKAESAQSLDQKDLRDQHSKIAEGNRSSQSFSIDREPPAPSHKLKDLASNALMFWKGRSGVSLAIQRFDQFDGEQWLQSQADQLHTESVAVEIKNRTWFRYRPMNIPTGPSPFISSQQEALKFTRFRSATIPTHHTLQLWHIDKVDRVDFFGKTHDDCLFMVDREHVPDYTTVNFINREINLEVIERLASQALSANITTARQRPPNEPLSCQSMLDDLRQKLIVDLPRGWPQVNAVIDGFRRDFAFDRQHSATDANESSLRSFLIERRGSDYLFATAAAMLLRDLGYETRLVTGFYANPDHLDRSSGELAIVPEDAHAWLEIRLGADTWIPLEPTPGYLQPSYHASLWYRLRKASPMVATALFVGFLILTAGWFARRPLFDIYCRLLWLPVRLLDDRRRIGWLSFVLDQRFCFLGKARPTGVTPRRWFAEQAFFNSEDLRESIPSFYDEADRIYFGVQEQLSSVGHRNMNRLWNEWTISNLRRDVR